MFSGLLWAADAMADSADEERKASPVNAKFAKVFQSGFWFYCCLLLSLPTVLLPQVGPAL